MTGIDRLSSTAGVGLSGLAGIEGGGALVAGAIGEIGGRILAWSDAASGRSSAAAATWAADTGAGRFTPDRAELDRGGDVYDLRDLSERIGNHLGATPTEQGRLLRAIEDVAREFAVQIFGLAGSERQMEGGRAALADALSATAPDGVDGVIQRLEAAAHRLREQNG